MWRARWTDPDTEEVTTLTLDTLKLTNATKRRAWAIAKSDEIARRRAEIKAGSHRVLGEEIPTALESFLTAKATEARRRTVESLTASLAHFRSWARAAEISNTRAINKPALGSLRDHILRSRRRRAVAGGDRGEKREEERLLSAGTRNRILREIGGLLREWRRRGLLLLHDDDIGDALRPVRAERKVADFLDVESLRQLLQAALEHDREVYSLTRREHAGNWPPGTTPRFEPVAPFLLAVLLTGARRGEIEGLNWTEVDLPGSAIVLDASRVKTGAGRRIDLGISPSLVRLLGVLGQERDTEKSQPVFPAWVPGHLAKSTATRLTRSYHAPPGWSWQKLRRTCSTFLTNAAFAGPWVSAKRAGHSVVVAERSYAGLLQVDPDARSLEQAMGIVDLAEEIVARAAAETASES